MKISNKKYILIGVIMFSFSILAIFILNDETIIGCTIFGILAFIFLIATIDYIINPDIKANKEGIKYYHRKINWNNIKYIDNYIHDDSEDGFAEWLYENYNLDISTIDNQEISTYKEEYLINSKGVYIAFDNNVLQLDLYLHLNDMKRTEIINKLNSMLALYKQA